MYQEIKKNKIPYIIITHSSFNFSNIPPHNIYPQAVEIFKNAEYLCFVSERIKRLTQRQLCCNLERTKIIFNPLNIKSLDLIKYPEDTTINFAMVANISNSKGHDVILEILSQDNWKHRNFRLNIYGKGYGEKYIRDLAKFYKISHKVFLRGYAKDIQELWKQNHILLIPSSHEGLPISLCEAMICGRPAVVADIGGHTEIIEEGKNGFIAEAPSVLYFSKALERAWQNKNNWQKLGEEAHKMAMNKIDTKAVETLFNLISINNTSSN